MNLSHTKRNYIIPLLLAFLTLTSCGTTSSSQGSTSNSTPTTSEGANSGATSEVVGTLTLEDLFLKVNDTIPLNPVFNPTSVASAITYDIADKEVVSISRSGILTALKVGVTTITATSETNLTDTFQVTVEENEVPPLSDIDQFNLDGQFEEASLPGWTLTGTSAAKHVIDLDADREQEDYALKLWPGEFSEEDETASLVDFTLALTSEVTLEEGDYTLRFDLVGNIAEIAVTLLDEVYSRETKDVVIGGAAYRRTYIEFSVTEETILTLSMKFDSPGTQLNWGFLDDVALDEGHTKPEIPAEPNDGNYLKDGSFEISGAQNITDLDTNTNEYLDWKIDGVLRVSESVTLNNWTTQGDFSLKYNYYPSAVNTERPVGDMKVYQHFTIEEAGIFNLSYYVAAGGITNTKLIILVDDVEVYSTAVANSASYTKKSLTGINLPAGDAEFRIHFQEQKDTWIHLDYLLLTKPA